MDLMTGVVLVVVVVVVDMVALAEPGEPAAEDLLLYSYSTMEPGEILQTVF